MPRAADLEVTGDAADMPRRTIAQRATTRPTTAYVPEDVVGPTHGRRVTAVIGGVATGEVHLRRIARPLSRAKQALSRTPRTPTPVHFETRVHVALPGSRAFVGMALVDSGAEICLVSSRLLLPAELVPAQQPKRLVQAGGDGHPLAGGSHGVAARLTFTATNGSPEGRPRCGDSAREIRQVEATRG